MEIIQEIEELLGELKSSVGAGVSLNRISGLAPCPDAKVTPRSGATGGIRLLVDDGKLNSPKKLSEIMEFLKQEGRHYSKQAISMGLLGLVRERTLTRLKDTGEKDWKYVIRR